MNNDLPDAGAAVMLSDSSRFSSVPGIGIDAFDCSQSLPGFCFNGGPDDFGGNVLRSYGLSSMPRPLTVVQFKISPESS